jgi:c-di-GMP-binding flagellar brake protein YcgR
MPVLTDPKTLILGDAVTIETQVDQVPLVIRGKLSNLLPKVVWVNVADPGCPNTMAELKEGHPVRLSAPREGSALVGDSTFRSCVGTTRRLVAVGRPAELRLVDRRAKVRIALRRSVGIRVARSSTAGEAGHFDIGTSVDIGVAGMRFETTVHMSVGDHVFVTIVLEQNRPLYALAQVIRLDDAALDRPYLARAVEAGWSGGRRPVRASVTWAEMCPADRQRLQQFLASVDRAALG